jgi:hypothetical protein
MVEAIAEKVEASRDSRTNVCKRKCGRIRVDIVESR